MKKSMFILFMIEFGFCILAIIIKWSAIVQSVDIAVFKLIGIYRGKWLQYFDYLKE